MNINFLLSELFPENEREGSIFTRKFKKSILFSTIFDFFLILELVFLMAHKLIVPTCLPTPTLLISNWWCVTIGRHCSIQNQVCFKHSTVISYF